MLSLDNYSSFQKNRNDAKSHYNIHSIGKFLKYLNTHLDLSYCLYKLGIYEALNLLDLSSLSGKVAKMQNNKIAILGSF